MYNKLPEWSGSNRWLIKSCDWKKNRENIQLMRWEWESEVGTVGLQLTVPRHNRGSYGTGPWSPVTYERGPWEPLGIDINWYNFRRWWLKQRTHETHEPNWVISPSVVENKQIEGIN